MTKQAKIISFANHKGGVGKTTTTASVGSILAAMGNRVLLVDMDAQSNLTTSLLKVEQVDQTIYDALSASCRGVSFNLSIYPIAENLDIVPSSLRLASADLELSSVMAREHILADILKPQVGNYDYILIDCPPSLGLLTLNSVTASDMVVIPLLAEVLPFQGLTMISDFIRMVKQKLNPKIEIAGILLTRWEKSNLSRQIEAGLRAKLGKGVFTTKIRKNIKVAEAPLEAVNIIDYDPKSNGALDYKAFVEELLEKTENK
uniref:ParA family protein n=1 Tax=Prevotella sp. GTC17254 TaxID=3236794 RepID=A0AB33IW35_9BACT